MLLFKIFIIIKLIGSMIYDIFLNKFIYINMIKLVLNLFGSYSYKTKKIF